MDQKVYIGSTCWDIAKRFKEHQRCVSKTREHSYRLYSDMRAIGVDLFFWEEIEPFPCENKSQLTAREGYWIRHYKSWEDEYGYNKKMEQRTKAEYYQDRKEEIKLKAKTYHMNNIEKAKVFYNECKQCCCGGTYTVANKARHDRSAKHQEGIINLLNE